MKAVCHSIPRFGECQIGFDLYYFGGKITIFSMLAIESKIKQRNCETIFLFHNELWFKRNYGNSNNLTGYEFPLTCFYFHAEMINKKVLVIMYNSKRWIILIIMYYKRRKNTNNRDKLSVLNVRKWRWYNFNTARESIFNFLKSFF